MPLILPEKPSSVARDLRRLLGSQKVKHDEATLRAYAVDASIYRLTPTAVALPDSEDDIDRIIDYAVQQGISVTARAAGTNLTGSAIGTGIILDVSRMNRILEVNSEEHWARVQPGIVLAELNKQLSRYDCMFGPDPSSGDMCKLGGMLANNSSGPHTLRYGSVKDNVQALRVRLPHGGWLDARSLDIDGPAWTQVTLTHPVLQPLIDLVRGHETLIEAKRPHVSKNSSGYNLFDLLDGMKRGQIDLPKLFVGSEGTLGIFSEATIRLVDRPKATASALIHFQHLEEMGEAVPELLTLHPSALEVMDANTLNLIGRETYGIPDDSAATLLIEFDQGEDPARSDRLLKLCRGYRLSADPVVAYDGEKQKELWKARKALYPTLYRYDQRKKPINFVDDVVVKAERTAELIRYLEKFFRRQEVEVAVFGHIGDGNAHILPLLDVNDAKDFQVMIDAHRDIHRVVLDQFGGSICGEHGDGRVRAEMVRLMFGDDLYQLFADVKHQLDPTGVMNPGVKISDAPFTDHIDFERLAKPCATCAKCNAVCPVYDVFQSEDMSSRGWFEIVTAEDYSYLQSQRVVEACLNCKSCRTVCPADVDVADLILQRRAEHPNRFMGWVFAWHARPWLFEPFLKVAGMTQHLWDRPSFRGVLEKLTRPLLRRLAPNAKIPKDLLLPRIAKATLRERYPELCANPKNNDAKVAYFHGCAANYFNDGVGDAVIRVLRKQGMEPALPVQRCSGTPIETYGHRDLVKEGARENLTNLAPYETVVTGCASCTLSLKDYPRLFKGEPEEELANQVAQRVKHISEMVKVSRTVQSPASSGHGRTITYHSSCHLRAAGVTKAPREVLASLPGVEFVEMQDADRCAGGAGTYMVKDYETSQKIFERKRNAILETGAEMVATSCPACMIQLKNGLRERVKVKHVAEVMDEHVE
ncbi:MAG: FAD-binding oxidoreductase [Nitrospirales bacterium]|nr:FAD-binding oxidoreductase [Nitrospira sp.]MDR4503047.1 FAD-binding oxidoreductase [Nitrospirales bacterium]